MSNTGNATLMQLAWGGRGETGPSGIFYFVTL